MNKMTLTPELTEALCDFCGSVDAMESNVDLIDCVESHLIDEETNEPAHVLDTLKALHTLKHDMKNILKAMRKAEEQ